MTGSTNRKQNSVFCFFYEDTTQVSNFKIFQKEINERENVVKVAKQAQQRTTMTDVSWLHWL